MDDRGERDRIYAAINGAIMDFRNAVGDQQFHAEDLRKFVIDHTKMIRAPASADRILRVMQQKRALAYVVVDRSKSLYQFVEIEEQRMGRRSDFVRRPHDSYQTIDPHAVRVLRPYLVRDRIRTFAEPCCGEGHLVRELEEYGFRCVLKNDILGGVDAMTIPMNDYRHADAIITNPPWTRRILHPMIRRFAECRDTWLLFDSDWAYNMQSGPYLDRCTDIVAVGRLRWFNDTSGKDNASWYRFQRDHKDGPRFHGRTTMDMTPRKPGELVSEYIALRDAKKQFEEMASAKCRDLYVNRMDNIEAELLELFNQLGVDQISGKDHTAFRTTSVSVTTADGGAFREYVIANAKWEMADWKPNRTQINQLVEEGQPLPPGVNRTTFASVQIRRK